MGEYRVTDQPLRLKLLSGPLLNYLTVIRPQIGCGVCRKPWRAKRHLGQSVNMVCQRCGVEFDDKCYFSRVAAPSERVIMEVGTEEELHHQFIFMCAGCRS